RIEITNVAAEASLIVSKATAYDSTSSAVVPLAQALPDHWRKVYDQNNVQIYENPRRLPRAWLVPKAKVVGEEEELKLIRDEGDQAFDPRRLALIEQAPPFKQAMPDGSFSQPPEVRVVNAEANRLVIETKADATAALVVSESYYPGWEATVDGEQAMIYPTDY